MLLPRSEPIPLQGAVHIGCHDLPRKKTCQQPHRQNEEPSLGLSCEQPALEPLTAGRAHQVQPLNSSNLASHFQKIQKMKIYYKILITG